MCGIIIFVRKTVILKPLFPWLRMIECENCMEPVWIAKKTSRALVRQYCLPRKPDTHKGNYGRILIIAGAEGYTGAPDWRLKRLSAAEPV